MRYEDYVTDQGPALLKLACALTGDPHRAEDLAQTVLADVYRHWGKVVSARSPDAYVRRMLVNAHLDWFRRRSSTELPTLHVPDRIMAEADPAGAVAIRDALREVLATLAPRARTALVLRYYLDLDDLAIAEAMGISTNTVRSTVSRALATLRGSGALDAMKEAP